MEKNQYRQPEKSAINYQIQTNGYCRLKILIRIEDAATLIGKFGLKNFNSTTLNSGLNFTNLLDFKKKCKN